MRAKNAKLAAVFLATSVGFAQVATGCTCVGQFPGPKGVEAAMLASDLVFSGYVVSKSVETRWSAQAERMAVNGDGVWEAGSVDLSSFSWRYGVGFVQPLSYTAHMKVFHVWKGDVGEEVDVMSQIDGSMCGYSFKVGKSYLVYARQWKTGTREVDLCGRTSELRDATDDAKALGAPITDHVRARAEALLEEHRASPSR